MKTRFALCVPVVLLALTGCMTAGQHRDAVRDDAGDRLTAGTVQREIHVGMSSAEVVEVLGAPNMVTTDEQRREAWVWDKISTDRAYSRSSGYGTMLIIGGASNAGADSTSQRTLTVIVKFDEAGKVRDFAYRQSSF
ncbi:hypothetical protein C882_4459 [Caenispirillum salinarum AK4]|uniref:Lipoprotein SmpA/OmlA domain-containing protein n=1 Tax=Caenispirillum salinarum AK4 TaxID=1238182 RepID=K9GWZ3_9PROT|nr:hypothetical protein [Caenispirillum salinarum]EKV30500.1 hypothetical protein C882_4459 [Caenispirillum salinarum AK4]